MSTTALFDRFQMQPVGSADLDVALTDAGDALVAVYLWGENCYNCEQFKIAAMLEAEVIAGLGLQWLHADVYADRALARRFSLHGVPAFFFFHRTRKLGRITGWPGWRTFVAAVQQLQRRIAAPSPGG